MLPEKLELQRERIQRELDAAYELPGGTVIAGWPKAYLPDYPGVVNLDIQIVLRRQGFPIREVKAMKFVGAMTSYEVYQGMPLETYLLHPEIYDVWMWLYAGEVGSVAGPEAMPTTKPGYEIVLTGQRKTIGLSSWCLYEMTDIYSTDYAKPGKMLASAVEKYEALKRVVSLCRKNKEFKRDESGGEYRNTRDIWRTGKYSPDDCDGFFAVIYRDVIEAGIKPEEVCVCSDVRRIGESKGHAMAAVAIPGDYLIGDGTGAYFQQEVVLLSEVIDRFQPFVIASHEGGGYPELRAVEPEPVVTVVPAVIDPFSPEMPSIPDGATVRELLVYEDRYSPKSPIKWTDDKRLPLEYCGADNMRRMYRSFLAAHTLVAWSMRRDWPDRPGLSAGDAMWDGTDTTTHGQHVGAPTFMDWNYPCLVPGYTQYMPSGARQMLKIWSGGNLSGSGSLLLDVIDLERIYWWIKRLQSIASCSIIIDAAICAEVNAWAAKRKLPGITYVIEDTSRKEGYHWIHIHTGIRHILWDAVIDWLERLSY